MQCAIAGLQTPLLFSADAVQNIGGVFADGSQQVRTNYPYIVGATLALYSPLWPIQGAGFYL